MRWAVYYTVFIVLISTLGTSETLWTKRHSWWGVVDKAVNTFESKSLLGSEKAAVHWKHASEIATHKLNTEMKIASQKDAISKLKRKMNGTMRRKNNRRAGNDRLSGAGEY